MELWSRLKRALGGSRRPEDEVREQIAALEADIVTLASAEQQLASEASRARREADEQRRRQSQWEEDARDCVRRGDDQAARECLERAEEARAAAEKAEQLATAAEKDLAQRRQRTAELRATVEGLRAEAARLASAGRYAEAETDIERSRQNLTTEGVGYLDALRRDVDAQELEAQVRREMAQSPADMAAQKRQSQAVDDRLAQLKAEMGKASPPSAAEPPEADATSTDRSMGERTE